MPELPVNRQVRPGEPAWSGQWVADRLGMAITPAPEAPATQPALSSLVGLALRRNAKRAHLLVSSVLGKHIPQRPHIVYECGYRLGERVRTLLGDGAAASAVVLGYAETATGLGHSVADGLALAPYLHSTRRPVPGLRPVGFEEEHSHATTHLLLPENPSLLAGDGPLILVDDEFSTGNTIRNTITALSRSSRRDRYVIVSLVDMRSTADRAGLEKFAATLGARVDVVALAAGNVTLPGDARARGAELIARYAAASGEARHSGTPAPVRRIDLPWPGGLPDGGRHGFAPAHRERLESALPALAAAVTDALPVGARQILVLGFEELMYAPLRIACAIEQSLAGAAEVRYSTTTRSPVLAVDDPGYAIRTSLTFPAHDNPTTAGERYAYNVAPGADTNRRFDAIVLVIDSVADTPAVHAPGGLLEQLRRTTDRVLLAVVPSYRPGRRPAA